MQNGTPMYYDSEYKVNYLFFFLQLMAAEGDNGFKVPSLVKLAAPLVGRNGSGCIREELA